MGLQHQLLQVFPLTGFSVAIGKISNPELTDDPLKNFIEDYKEMMKEQAETKPRYTNRSITIKDGKKSGICPYQTI